MGYGVTGGKDQSTKVVGLFTGAIAIKINWIGIGTDKETEREVQISNYLYLAQYPGNINPIN